MGAKREFPPFSSSSSFLLLLLFKYKEFWLNHITSKCFGRSGDCDIVPGEVAFERHPQGWGGYQGEHGPGKK